MNRLRQEDSSLYLYLKDIVLSDFIEKQEWVPLTYNEALTIGTTRVYEIDDYFDPSPKTRGRGFVYFDDLTNECLVNTTTYSGTAEQSNRIKVYTASGTEISDLSYVIDYVDCRVITDQVGVVPSYIDYHWYYISVLDEWGAVKTTPPPAVVIDLNSSVKTGFQLGHGIKSIRKCILHVFGSDPAERNDIVELLHNGLYLRSCPLYTFDKGVVLDSDGLFNGRKGNMDKSEVLFDRTTVSGVSRMQFENIESRNIRMPDTMNRGITDVMLSSINAYRATVTFDIITYSE